MSKILEMRQKRAEIWEQAKAFLEAHQGDDGVMNAEDTEQYERMEQEVVDMGHAIERMERAEQMDREMNSPANPAITDQPERPMPRQDDKRGTASDAYKKAFWSQIRGRTSYEIRNALQVGEETEGGYTVPDEFEHQLIEALQEENIMRNMVHVITTSSGDRKIPLVTDYGTASWIEEEEQIPESDVAFSQITLGAHKLATAIRISQELLHDPDPELTFSTNMADIPLAIQEMIFGNTIDENGVLIMITCTLGDKKYSVDFISGRALREIGDAQKMYELVTKNAQAAERGEPLDESVEYTEILDTMVRWFCVLFNNQFTPDEFYDNYPADKVMFDIAMALIAVNRAATNVLSEFPTKADPAPRKK